MVCTLGCDTLIRTTHPTMSKDFFITGRLSDSRKSYPAPRSEAPLLRWGALISVFKFHAAVALCLGLPLLLTSCTGSTNRPVIIWTSSPELASYVELFNASQEKAKAVVVYKEHTARSLPPARDEVPPDIVIGPWLKNSNTRKLFTPLDYLFNNQYIYRALFYPQLIDYGAISEKQYLLPLSFNLPVIVYNIKNESFITNDQALTLDAIKISAGNFNVKNKNDVYTAMGFAPSWNKDFLYVASKLFGASYREKGTSFSWNEKAMFSAVTYLHDWTMAQNTDTAAEQNFQFKYLYMPAYKQVSDGRCLFAYMTSDVLFTLTEEQAQGLSFRWIYERERIPVEDAVITLGLYKHSRNVKQAEVFINWFFKEDTQTALLERTAAMKLDTRTFGIAGGFSALRNVSEKVYPVYYRQLLGNLPAAEFLTMPNILPYHWPSLQEQVIIPYLQESTSTINEGQSQTLEERITEWNKQYF